MPPSGIVVSLCDYTGNMVRPWAEAGFTAYAVDIQHSIRRDRIEHLAGGGSIHYVWGDVRSWQPPARVGILFASTPCTHLAASGARDFRKKGYPPLRDGLDLFHAAYQAAVWAQGPFALENPVGRIAGIVGKAEHTFDPCDYGDPYTKKTCLWTGGGFIMPPKRRIEPTEGSKIIDYPPSDNRADLRSATPMGFARAVHEANNHLVQ
jgi:hypothetical protein